MKPNVGTADRIMRIAIDPGLIAASVLGTIGKANRGRWPFADAGSPCHRRV